MRNLVKEIERLGGIKALKSKNSLRLRSEGYMDLVLEYVGKGPRNLDTISVAHYYEQNGDLMRDPEIVFEIEQKTDETGKNEQIFHPVEYWQDGLPFLNGPVVWIEDGKILCKPNSITSIKSFAKTWDQNLKSQGFFGK
ncbi:DUF6908 domain-containing protein [Leptospira licerasiae]|uniref:DUF6908 domain-containing protein n=1 Tax=Leptospira licerasiae str. MMD4847 TaxID=1049971 RepID=A0ABN0H9Q2_9LEPT|nr:hypothetical protein [Leptospira licerasiae]EIE01477.1 hypothetical protein LEP1GSC185_3965 [Leptospira licerasiae serovar Varillal str. VAR 010]EJZ42317.1 hypothetical protein LEP1GSC178_0034 [Leptospira licerasiae str. MMD4847]